MKKFIVFLIIVVLFDSCVKDKPKVNIQPEINVSSNNKILVINEGPFQNGNGSISLYDATTGSVIENYYKNQNDEELGNIVQSLSFINGKYYIVVNNSNKVVVCDNQFKKISQIGELNSPRRIISISNQKAYISDLYANAISIIDLNQNKKVGSISCFGKTEQMEMLYGKVYVTNTDKKYVYVINASTDSIEDSVFVGLNASSLIIDKNDKLWVLSSGSGTGEVARLSKLNPASNRTEVIYDFNKSDSPYNLCLNKTKDTLYYLNNGVFRMPIESTALMNTPIIPKGTKNFYGLGVNPKDYSIYVSDALDYMQKSNCYIYDVNGNQKSFFKAGIISNGFYFE